jgi:hypothetical protein
MTGRGVGGEEVLTSNFRKNRAAKSFLKFYDEDDEKENAIDIYRENRVWISNIQPSNISNALVQNSISLRSCTSCKQPPCQ